MAVSDVGNTLMIHATNSLTARDVMLIADNISKAGCSWGCVLVDLGSVIRFASG
jgi:hypothetical protein